MECNNRVLVPSFLSEFMLYVSICVKANKVSLILWKQQCCTPMAGTQFFHIRKISVYLNGGTNEKS
jgi:hypothetical protein